MKSKHYGSTGRDVHIDVPLSNVAIAYRPEGFICDLIAPIVTVKKQSDGYYIWNIGDAYRTEDDKRAPATEANVISRSVSSGTYFAKNYALKDRIPYEDLKNADAGWVWSERSSRAEMVKDKLMLNWEYRLALQVTSGSNCGSYSAVASGWQDETAGNSDPVKDINTGINNVEDFTGQRPNSLVFGRYSWRLFREHAGVIARIWGDTGQTAKAKMVNLEHVKALFEVERVLVGGTYRNTTDEGQTESLSKIWNDQCLTYYAPMKPRKDKPSFMYSFRWPAVRDLGMSAEVHQLPRAKAEEVEIGYYQDEKITASALSFLITGVGSSQ